MEMRMEEGGFAVIAKRGLISALGVLVGSYLIDGINYESGATLLLVVVVLGLFTAVLKPLLVLLALPFVVLTLGLGVLFINALLYLLVGNLVPGFTVDGFGSAFLGALVITLLNLLFSGWISPGRARFRVNSVDGRAAGPRARPRAEKAKVKAKDDVIDI